MRGLERVGAPFRRHSRPFLAVRLFLQVNRLKFPRKSGYFSGCTTSYGILSICKISRRISNKFITRILLFNIYSASALSARRIWRTLCRRTHDARKIIETKRDDASSTRA